MSTIMDDDDLNLAKKAAAGDKVAREEVSRRAHSLIKGQTKRFCKQFCFSNHVHLRCTADAQWGLQSEDASFCVWGNHSYAWMLEDLSGPKQLRRFSGKDGAKLSTYFYTIGHSRPFYERWKNFRFKRRIYIPEYIQKISPLAGNIFRWMIDQHPTGHMVQKALKVQIAQKAQQGEGAIIQITDEMISEDAIIEVADAMIAELTERGKLYLLNTPRIVSLTGLAEDEAPDSESLIADVVDDSWNPEEEQQRQLIAEGLKELTAVEHFVIEAMVFDNREAGDVLKALILADISIKPGVAPENLNRQQLFYFKRKTLAKLRQILK